MLFQKKFSRLFVCLVGKKDNMITLGDYLIVSGTLFAIGFAGVMLRRNLIIILMSLELMLNAANLISRRFFSLPGRSNRSAELQRASLCFFHHHRRGRRSRGRPGHHRRPLSRPANHRRERHQQPEILAHETHEMTRKEEKTELVFKEESYVIIGACFEVYKDKGSGFHEPFITNASKSSWNSRGFRFSRSHRRDCNIAAARLRRHSTPTLFATTRLSSKSKPSPPCAMSIALSFELSRGNRFGVGFARKLRPLSKDGVRASSPRKNQPADFRL